MVTGRKPFDYSNDCMTRNEYDNAMNANVTQCPSHEAHRRPPHNAPLPRHEVGRLLTLSSYTIHTNPPHRWIKVNNTTGIIDMGIESTRRFKKFREEKDSIEGPAFEAQK